MGDYASYQEPITVKKLPGSVQFNGGGGDLEATDRVNIRVLYPGDGSEIGVLTTDDLYVNRDAYISGNLSVYGNTTYISTNTLVIEDPIIEMANKAPDGTTMGLVMQRPSGNVMMGYLSTENSNCYDNTLVFAYTSGSAYDTKLPVISDSNLAVYVHGSADINRDLHVGGNLCPGTNTRSGSTMIVNTSSKHVGIDNMNPAYALDIGTPSNVVVDTTTNEVKFANDIKIRTLNSDIGNSIAIGEDAGNSSTQVSSIAIGYNAGQTQYSGATAVGILAGNFQGQQAVALGAYSGSLNQGNFAVAVGSNAGNSDQNAHSIAIGSEAGYTGQYSNSVAIGTLAGYEGQQNQSIAVGSAAGNTNQGHNSVAIGGYAGSLFQKPNSISIGSEAGYIGQNANSIAIGSFAGYAEQQSQSIALGSAAGNNQQNAYSIAIGYEAGYTGQYSNSVAIGTLAGYSNQKGDSMALGNGAGQTNQNTLATAIGAGAGNTNQGEGATAIGTRAGFSNQNAYSVAIGTDAGNTGQYSNSVAIGYLAGYSGQKNDSLALGRGAGQTNQDTFATAIGAGAGNTNQGERSVAIGTGAGASNQGQNCVAIGSGAGANNQNTFAVAIGHSAGVQSQGVGAVSIGSNAGNQTQGDASVCIGWQFGNNTQHSNTIVLNANGGVILESDKTDAMFVKPIRHAETTYGNLLSYDTTTGEITNSSNIRLDSLLSNCVVYTNASNTLSTTANFTFDETSSILTLDSGLGGYVMRALEPVKNNVAAGFITGQPVYISDEQGDSILKADLANNSDSSTMPAIGLALEDSDFGDDTHVVRSGKIKNVQANATSNVFEHPISGDDLNKVVYVSSTPGKLTLYRPTSATELIQNIGVIVRVKNDGGGGTNRNVTILVQGAGRANDVPNRILAVDGSFSERLTVGNVAINTSANMYVYGNTYIESGDLYFYDTGSGASADATSGLIKTDYSGTSFAQDSRMSFHTRNTTNNTDPLTERMVISEPGYVGIGTSAPNNLLTLRGTTTGFGMNLKGDGLSTNEYNIISFEKGGTSTTGLVLFQNGTTRTVDNGASAATIRNDSGDLYIGNPLFPTYVPSQLEVSRFSQPGIGITHTAPATDERWSMFIDNSPATNRSLSWYSSYSASIKMDLETSGILQTYNGANKLVVAPGGQIYANFGAAANQGAGIYFGDNGTTSTILPTDSQGTLVTSYTDLGTASFLWRNIYLQNAPIVLSDKTLKTPMLTGENLASNLGAISGVSNIDEKLSNVASHIKNSIGFFKYLEGDELVHSGVFAQDVEQIFVDNGLDSDKFSVVRKSNVYTYNGTDINELWSNVLDSNDLIVNPNPQEIREMEMTYEQVQGKSVGNNWYANTYSDFDTYATSNIKYYVTGDGTKIDFAYSNNYSHNPIEYFINEMPPDETPPDTPDGFRASNTEEILSFLTEEDGNYYFKDTEVKSIKQEINGPVEKFTFETTPPPDDDNSYISFDFYKTLNFGDLYIFIKTEGLVLSIHTRLKRFTPVTDFNVIGTEKTDYFDSNALLITQVYTKEGEIPLINQRPDHISILGWERVTDLSGYQRSDTYHINYTELLVFLVKHIKTDFTDLNVGYKTERPGTSLVVGGNAHVTNSITVGSNLTIDDTASSVLEVNGNAHVSNILRCKEIHLDTFTANTYIHTPSFFCKKIKPEPDVSTHVISDTYTPIVTRTGNILYIAGPLQISNIEIDGSSVQLTIKWKLSDLGINTPVLITQPDEGSMPEPSVELMNDLSTPSITIPDFNGGDTHLHMTFNSSVTDGTSTQVFRVTLAIISYDPTIGQEGT